MGHHFENPRIQKYLFLRKNAAWLKEQFNFNFLVIPLLLINITYDKWAYSIVVL